MAYSNNKTEGYATFEPGHSAGQDASAAPAARYSRTYYAAMLEVIGLKLAGSRNRLDYFIEHRLAISSITRVAVAEVTLVLRKPPHEGLKVRLLQPIRVGPAQEAWSCSVDRVEIRIRHILSGRPNHLV